MINDNDLTDWGFENIDMFFDHIIDFVAISNLRLADENIAMLSPAQKKDFISYLVKLHKGWNPDVQYCFDRVLMGF